MQPIYKSGFSNKILSDSDIKTIQQMYGIARNVIVTAILTLSKQKLWSEKYYKLNKAQRQKGLK